MSGTLVRAGRRLLQRGVFGGDHGELDLLLDVVRLRRKIAWAFDPPDEAATLVFRQRRRARAVSYTHLRAHETVLDLVCRLLIDTKQKWNDNSNYNVRN